MGKFLRSKIFAQIHHNYNHYITIEIFAILNIRKKKKSQINSSLQYITSLAFYIACLTSLCSYSASSDDMWAYAILEQILGAGPQVKWASNTTSSLLNAAVSKQTQDPFNVRTLCSIISPPVTVLLSVMRTWVCYRFRRSM